MADKESRLLTGDELAEVDMQSYLDGKGYIEGRLEAQDAKTRAETLKEVGEHFTQRIITLSETNWTDEAQRKQIMVELEALKSGTMPDKE